MIRKNRKSELGMSAVPLVIAILLLVIAIVMYYKADQEATDLRGRMKANADSASQWEAKWTAENNKHLELTEVVGFPDAQNKPDKAALQAALNAALEKWRTTFTIEFAADKFTPTGNGGQIEKLPGDKVKVIYVPAKDMITNPSIGAVLAIFERAAAAMQADVKRGFELHAAEVKAKLEQKTAFDKAVGEKEAAHTSLQNEYAQSKRTYEEKIREQADQISAKDQALQAAQSELETVKAESEKAVAAATAVVNQKAAEIQTLVRREKPFISEGPDGEVVGAGNGIVVVSRGKKDMLMPGTVFKVLGRIKGGELVEKGSVKVVLCNDTTAECRVMSEAAGNPITGGDLIQSLTYSPDRKIRFVLVGEFRKMGRAEAESRLGQLGAAVDANVTTETHYLVMGAPGAGEALEDTDAYKKAKEYGVEILTEAQLASFTMY